MGFQLSADVGRRPVALTKKNVIMDKPKIAACFPKQVEIEAGKKYAYCTCGLSANQPFCDGKHQGTSFVPLVFEAEQSETAYYCQCKQTGNAPKCDGTHKSVGEPESEGDSSEV